jgi:hypothetical protein
VLSREDEPGRTVRQDEAAGHTGAQEHRDGGEEDDSIAPTPPSAAYALQVGC